MSDTRNHILNVSSRLFLQKSFKEVTMKEIVKQTGMSKGAFYHHFESKEQLFMEVINNLIASMSIDYSKLSKDSLYKFYNDYINNLNNIVNSLIRNGSDINYEFNFNYYSLIFEALRFFPDFQKKVSEFLQTESKAWKDIIRTARNQGEIESAMNDEEIASVFIHTADGVGIRRNLMKDTSRDMRKCLLPLWDSFYKQLKA